MSTKTSAGRVRQIYKFIELHKTEYSVHDPNPGFRTDVKWKIRHNFDL
jgi:hypothetical protein